MNQEEQTTLPTKDENDIVVESSKESSDNLFLKLYHFSNSWTGTLIIVLMVIFFVAQAFVIPSGSMKNTLLVGDYLFVKKYVYGIPTPHITWLEIPVWFDSDGDGHIIKGEGPKR